MSAVTAEHRRYVESGRCPFVEGKTWCNGLAGHSGQHWAQRIPNPDQPIGPKNPTRVTLYAKRDTPSRRKNYYLGGKPS